MLIRMINSMFVEITEALEHLVHSFGILPVKAEWEPTIKQAKELIRNKFQVFFGVDKCWLDVGDSGMLFGMSPTPVWNAGRLL